MRAMGDGSFSKFVTPAVAFAVLAATEFFVLFAFLSQLLLFHHKRLYFTCVLIIQMDSILFHHAGSYRKIFKAEWHDSDRQFQRLLRLCTVGVLWNCSLSYMNAKDDIRIWSVKVLCAHALPVSVLFDSNDRATSSGAHGNQIYKIPAFRLIIRQ